MTKLKKCCRKFGHNHFKNSIKSYSDVVRKVSSQDCAAISNRSVQLTVGSSSVASQLIRKGKLLKSLMDFRDFTSALTERRQKGKSAGNRLPDGGRRIRMPESDADLRNLRSGRTVNLPI